MDYFLGNQKLKRCNVPVNYTEEQVQDFIRCSKDPIYFIRNFMKIINVDDGLVNFNMWPYQEVMINKMINSRFSIYKLPRQVGKTICTSAIILWYILFHQNYAVAVLAHKQDQSINILDRIRTGYENLPKWLQQGIVEWNKKTIVLENGSRVETAATTGGSIRGEAFNLIYLDEFAFVPGNIQENFYSAVYPTISSGKKTKIIITSTPNGLNKFYRLWNDAINGKNTFVPYSVHWSSVPGRDEKWKEETIKNTSEQQFRAEFETEFIGSTNTLIDAEILQNLLSEVKTPISANEHMSIYSMPEKGRYYVVVVDPARGVGGDYSAFCVIDTTEYPYEVVMTYKNNRISPLIFPNYIQEAAKRYNDAFVCVEVNDNGQQVADILFTELDYENLFYTEMRGAKGQILTYKAGPNIHRGVRTTKQVKRIGCTNLKTIIESGKIKINDNNIVDELCTFSQSGDSYEAEEGYHDDLVMTLVIFSWLTTQEIFKNLINKNMREKLFMEKKQSIEDDFHSLSFMSNVENNEDYEVVAPLEMIDRYLISE